MNHGISSWILAVSALSLISTAQVQNVIAANESSGLINTNPDLNGEPWIAGGITFEEWNSSLPEPQEMTLSKMGASAALPAKIDNTKYAAFRPVFNQKGGSCAQASGIAYLYTYEINTLRNLPSNIAKNQYPYDFTYNFLNTGSGQRGSTSPDGWKIVQALGVPNVETYGGFGTGKFTEWLSGYDAYYQGMANRLGETFSIRTKVADDIIKMKQFLFDHSNGSPTGGVLTFAANVTGEKIIKLASGTPESGKRAIVSFGASGGHAMTIVGYDDSVRYDYNGDGYYTNNKDITNDGKIDVRDWEIGAAVMVNSWGTKWGDNGKAYLMYRVLASSQAQNGIWGNAVSGITIKEPNYTPLLTYKVRMTYNPRSSIKIVTGYSSNASDLKPQRTKSFGKAFYYAGGEFPMQGTSDKTIEIGLDVSDFTPMITDPVAAFFLQIDSRSGSGKVEQFSIIDYASGKGVETICNDKNILITTGTKTLKIVRTAAPLLVVSPNGGEKWERDRTFDIVWSTKEDGQVSIELLNDGKLHSTIASSAPSTGSFAWSIPSSMELGNNYSIRVRNKDKTNITDASDKAFSIENRSKLTLITSDTSEYLLKGKSSTIFWESNVAGDIKIDLYRHGVLEANIGTHKISSNSYTWNIPDSITSGYDYRIRITSKEKDWLYDESQSDFAIGNPIVSSPYKQTFDNFNSGEMLTENWEQVKDDDINWTIINGATPSKINPNAKGTGPSSDHTNGRGKYIYVEASIPNNPGKDASLLSPVFNIDGLHEVQASFWCHMFSREQRMGHLWVDVYANGQWNDSVLYLTGDHEDEWFQQVIDLSKFNSTLVQLRFRVLTGTDYDSDICIDDFSISGTKTSITQLNREPLKKTILIANNTILLTGYSGRIKIITINGRQVFNKVINSNIQKIDFSHLSGGMYFLDVNNKVVSFIRH